MSFLLRGREGGVGAVAALVGEPKVATSWRRRRRRWALTVRWRTAHLWRRRRRGEGDAGEGNV